MTADAAITALVERLQESTKVWPLSVFDARVLLAEAAAALQQLVAERDEARQAATQLLQAVGMAKDALAIERAAKEQSEAALVEAGRRIAELETPRACPECEAVAQQLLQTSWANVAKQGHAFLAQSVEGLAADLRLCLRSRRGP